MDTLPKSAPKKSKAEDKPGEDQGGGQQDQVCSGQVGAGEEAEEEVAGRAWGYSATPIWRSPSRSRVAMLVAFAYAGWVGPSELWQKFVLAIGLPALAILLWVVWAAPKAGKLKLGEPGLTIFKVLIFAVATFLLWASQLPFWPLYSGYWRRPM